MDYEELLRLEGKPLEAAVRSVLEDLDARAEFGPPNERDVEVSFPNGFRRKVATGAIVFLASRKRFVVEVKSNGKGGAALKDLRQLHDWVLRETRKLVSPEDQEHYLQALQLAIGRTRDSFDDLQGAFKAGKLEEEVVDDLDWDLAQVQSGIEIAVHSLTYLVKGVLVINDQFKISPEKRKVPLDRQALGYSLSNKLAVISWVDLLKVHASVTSGKVDSLDFWCPLYEASGYFTDFNYSWRSRSDFHYTLMPSDGANLALANGPKFLKPGPEEYLSGVMRRTPGLKRTDTAQSRGPAA